MSDALPKINISDQSPIDTSALRNHELFQIADPTGEIPNTYLGSGPLNPHDRPHKISTRVGIKNSAGISVGAMNLIQTRAHSWINDVRIEQAHRGEHLAVSAYLGTIANLHTVGRRLQSDPGGLSTESNRVWQSLKRRGVAVIVEGAQDQHGNPRYVSVHPQTPQTTT